MLKDAALDSIHHLAIHVSNINDGVKWYQEHFKCDIVYQDDSWAFLKFANIYLALVLPGQHPAHFAFAEENPEKYGKVKQHRDDTASVYIRDPFGNAIEMVKGVDHYE